MDTNNAGSHSQENLQNLLLDSHGFSEFMLELAVSAASDLGSGAPVLCSITVERDFLPITVASSGAQALILDERQYVRNSGPCLSALRNQKTVFVPNLARSKHWTAYSLDIHSSGVAAILAIPVAAGPRTAAALNCYAFDTITMDVSFRAAVELMAASLSGILRLALRIHPGVSAGSGSIPEIDSRAVVDSAVGFIMMKERCSREEAFGRLGQLALAGKLRMRDQAAILLWESRRTI
ncbi:GAF and ANTAR domain-containing protein [Arthrobacter psychrolactophilus]|uniref:GAF and ANTAR domain-containing protein n=1 Tax=Arthrobacter psychrolactophilus TaxID=92442 RepID=UPI0015E8CC9E|nr:GAF and ANTAR domain-containing protein [Arthrobacter psychrolactophilus]